MKKGSPSVQHPLSSTHQFYTKGPLHFSPQNPSVTHQKPLSSAQLLVPHQKPLRSTPKTPQFHCPLPQFHTKKQPPLRKTPPLRQKLCWTEGFSVELWDLGVDLRGFGVEMRDFRYWKGVAVLCGTDVLNWRGCGTEGDPFQIQKIEL